MIEQMQGRVCDSPAIEQRMQELVSVPKSVKGKKQYAYLPKEAKAVVDSIVDELAKQPELAACYEAWNKLRDELEAYYKDKPRKHLPLSQQKELHHLPRLSVPDNRRAGEVRTSH